MEGFKKTLQGMELTEKSRWADMQEEVKELRKKMGEEAIQEEQKKILKPMMESFTKKWECLLTNADNRI